MKTSIQLLGLASLKKLKYNTIQTRVHDADDRKQIFIFLHTAHAYAKQAARSRFVDDEFLRISRRRSCLASFLVDMDEAPPSTSKK